MLYPSQILMYGRVGLPTIGEIGIWIAYAYYGVIHNEGLWENWWIIIIIATPRRAPSESLREYRNRGAADIVNEHNYDDVILL